MRFIRLCIIVTIVATSFKIFNLLDNLHIHIVDNFDSKRILTWIVTMATSLALTFNGILFFKKRWVLPGILSLALIIPKSALSLGYQSLAMMDLLIIFVYIFSVLYLLYSLSFIISKARKIRLFLIFGIVKTTTFGFMFVVLIYESVTKFSMVGPGWTDSFILIEFAADILFVFALFKLDDSKSIKDSDVIDNSTLANNA